MKITSRLMEESKAMAKDAAPAVFSIVEVLQDARLLDRLISGPEHRLSLPRVLGAEGLVARNEEESEEVEGMNLMEVLERPARQEERRRGDEKKRVEMDRRLRSRFKERRKGDERKRVEMDRRL